MDLIRFSVRFGSVWYCLAANIIDRRCKCCTASNAQNTTAPRCSIKASTHYPSSSSGSCWQAIDPAHTSDAKYPKQCTYHLQLCASAIHKEREPRSSSRTRRGEERAAHFHRGGHQIQVGQMHVCQRATRYWKKRTCQRSLSRHSRNRRSQGSVDQLHEREMLRGYLRQADQRTQWS